MIICGLLFFCDPAGARTQDPYIKSVMLYRLSYGIEIIFSKRGRKSMLLVEIIKTILLFY